MELVRRICGRGRGRKRVLWKEKIECNNILSNLNNFRFIPFGFLFLHFVVFDFWNCDVSFWDCGRGGQDSRWWESCDREYDEKCYSFGRRTFLHFRRFHWILLAEQQMREICWTFTWKNTSHSSLSLPLSCIACMCVSSGRIIIKKENFSIWLRTVFRGKCWRPFSNSIKWDGLGSWFELILLPLA